MILDARRGAKTKLIEPYSEGSDVSLICEVNGGEFINCSAPHLAVFPLGASMRFRGVN